MDKAVRKAYNTESNFMTMVQGDCWLNNMLFREDKDGLKMKMLDYGMIHR